MPMRVIGQAQNGLATIELSSGGKCHLSKFYYAQMVWFVLCFSLILVQRNHNTHQHATNGAQLHKLLVSGSNSTTNTVASTVNCAVAAVAAAGTPELARLPGGAELNILPAGTNGTTSIYRSNNGKVAIVNNGFTFKGVPHPNARS